MAKLIEIICKNTGIKKIYPIGTSLKDIIKDQNIKLKYPILGARVNNEIEELSYEIFKPKIIEFFDYTNKDGQRMYIRALSFILLKATRDEYPEYELGIEHAIAKGYYCEFANLKQPISEEIVNRIKNRMLQIITEDIKFTRKEVLAEEAIRIFNENNYIEKTVLFETCPEFYTSIYSLDGLLDYFYGYLIPSTSYIHLFGLIPYYDGMLLQIPKSSNPDILETVVEQNKMYEIFKEFKQWGKIFNVSTIGRINQTVMNKTIGEILKISEALHEKKVAQIADRICNEADKKKIILIAGPSSSGKTTFSKRLAIQLKVAGKKPIQISLDDYFLDREDTPKDENGVYDFETIYALDIELLNNNMNTLMSGGEIKIPRFSFVTGKRYFQGDTMRMNDDDILLLEGIHGLNPELTKMIDNKVKYKIYVSALTQLGIDKHNRIPTTDNRLIRRIIRDYQYRNYSATQTLSRWDSVRRGEEKYIFPFQEEADVMFNSFLVFELGVLKRYAEPILKEVKPIEPEYSEASRLLKFLSYFKPIDDEEIPPTSILREFLSGSTFKYS